jgi:hypothetical protein
MGRDLSHKIAKINGLCKSVRQFCERKVMKRADEYRAKDVKRYCIPTVAFALWHIIARHLLRFSQYNRKR